MCKKQHIITLILILALLTLNNIHFSNQQPTPHPVHNINTGLSYSTIQAAINAQETLNGHKIYVEAGTYIENLVINKSISLIGENKQNTIINGNHTQNVIYVTATNVKIENFTIKNSGFGYSAVHLSHTYECNITNNKLKNSYYGIQLYNSNKNLIYANFISNCQYGIHLYNSTNNNISTNTIQKNKNGIHLHTSHKNTIKHNNISSNIWNGIYLHSSTNNTITNNNLNLNKARGIRLHNSITNTLSYNSITKSHDGIHLYNSNNNKLLINTVLNNTDGIWLAYSNQNIIHANTISLNKQYGLRILNSTKNKIYHNNFINNTKKNVEPPSNTSILNTWDNMKEGNYWSDHIGIDNNKDGISDTPYKIDKRAWLGIYSQDSYPLMAPYQQFNIQIQNQTHPIQLISNSKATNIQHSSKNKENKTLTIKLTNTQKKGFTRICIPHKLVNPPYTVTINGANLIFNNTLHTNGTHTWIYTEYLNQANSSKIIITHTPSLIPQPPIWTQWTFWGMLTLMIIAVSLLRLSFKYKQTINKQQNLIQAYEEKLRKTSHLAIASTLFKEDVKKRKNKIAQFEKKYGMKIKPRNSIDNIIKSIKAKEKRKEE